MAGNTQVEKAIPALCLLSHVVHGAQGSNELGFSQEPLILNFNTFPLAALLEILGYSLYFSFLPSIPHSHQI